MYVLKKKKILEEILENIKRDESKNLMKDAIVLLGIFYQKITNLRSM